jgi:hypothetical protein
LATLTSKTPRLKPALDKPNSAYNQFISTWNNGTGDIQKSYLQINEFWRLLQAAQPELDRLMISQPPDRQPPPTPRGTPAERTVIKTLRTQTNDLYEVFSSYLTHHGPPTAPSTIQNHVRVIGELLINSSLGQQAQTALTTSKTEWRKFTVLYNNGTGIANNCNCLKQLVEFQNVANMACVRFLG